MPCSPSQDGEYRAGCKAVASLVERFGLDNVQRVLETRRSATAHYDDQGGHFNDDDDEYDNDDDDVDENGDLYDTDASQAVEPLQRRSASTGVSSITYNSGQGISSSSSSGRRASGSGSNSSHLSNELRVGDFVQWCQSDEDLPEGAVGEVRVGWCQRRWWWRC